MGKGLKRTNRASKYLWEVYFCCVFFFFFFLFGLEFFCLFFFFLVSFLFFGGGEGEWEVGGEEKGGVEAEISLPPFSSPNSHLPNALK